MADDKTTPTQEGTDLAHRVFYTLSQKHDEQARRNSKAIALLMKLLEERGVITSAEVDRLLVSVSRWDL
jgi:CRISPR/Cas system-associated protein Csm6